MLSYILFSVSKDEITSEQDEDGEDGVDVTVQREDGVTTSTIDSCHVSIGSLESIRMTFLHWTFLLEIWGLSWPGKVQAVMPVQAHNSLSANCVHMYWPCQGEESPVQEGR